MSSKEEPHYAGFVGIIGLANAGKSTLMEKVLGEKLSIITPKAQTTRHNILGIVNEKNSQIIFIDTPGIIKKPQYSLQRQMMAFVRESLKDLEVVIYMTTVFENPEDILEHIKQINLPIILVINKIDLGNPEDILKQVAFFEKKVPQHEIIVLSALLGLGLLKLQELIKQKLPLHPPYYDKDVLTDRPLRFFISEIIREKILLIYQKEIPYCSEVVIDSFKSEKDIIHITGRIIVERETQKHIVVGKGARMIKAVSIAARKDLRNFLKKKIFLHLEVKVIPKWREKNSTLKEFGYIQ